jgi:hypothetical protein
MKGSKTQALISIYRLKGRKSAAWTEFLTPPEIAAMRGLPKRKRERAGAVTVAVFRYLFWRVLPFGQPVVIQYMAHPLHKLHPLFGAQVGPGDMLRQIEKLPPFIIIKQLMIIALFRWCRRWCNLQSLLHPLHGGVLIPVRSLRCAWGSMAGLTESSWLCYNHP